MANPAKRLAPPPNQVVAAVLGIMQDAGMPHVGCRCSRCAAAFANPALVQYAACLAVIDGRRRPPGVWLIDATPDIKYQINLLAGVLGPHPTMAGRLRQPDGLFLTHAHMGHTAGLAHLGPEAMNVRELSLYAPAGLIGALRGSPLWRPLLAGLRLFPLEANRPLTLAPDLVLTPLPVPHRDELGIGTFAYRIAGPEGALLYLPDIDRWEDWPLARESLTTVDVALVDASFFSADELGGRSPVAHPLVPDTLAFCADLPGRLVLTHFNHTNPVLDSGAARQQVAAAGVELAFTGQVFSL